jgi:hypothetical protein
MKTTTRTTRTLGAVALAASAVLAASPAAAQTDVDLDVRGGLGIPTMDMNDVAETGGLFGLGVGLPIHDRVNVRLDGDVEILQGIEDEAARVPNHRLWHYHAGLEFQLLEDARSFFVQPRVGLGGTTVDADVIDFPGGGEVPDEIEFTETYFSLSAGLELGYQASSRVQVGLGSRGFVAFGEDEELARLTQLAPGVGNFDQVSSLPVYFFLRFNPSMR